MTFAEMKEIVRKVWAALRDRFFAAPSVGNVATSA